MSVSVVVPVYNPGASIEACITSLLGQSMAPDRLELIFADDGSTDGTSARLDLLATEHPHVRVIHEPNSGWAGRPRNVGTDAARGEYVQYVDQDDRLGPKALERLYDFATANDADIVIGKVTSNFRPVPHALWRQNVARCSIRTHPLITSLTPHKMFRTSFLRDNGIRFPEGKRRLEDQVFMVAAYFATDAVAILGDYPCYFYERRVEGQNAGAANVDPVGYYANLREVLDIVEENAEPGAFRDDLLRHFLGLIIRRVSGVATDHSLPAGYAESLFEQARAVVLERFPPPVRESLPTLRRSRVAALAAGDFTQLLSKSIEIDGIRAYADVLGARSSADGWALRIRTGMRDLDGQPLTLGPDPRDVVETSVYARERRRGVEWQSLPIDPESEVVINPRQLAAGKALGPGSWQLGLRLQRFGIARGPKLRLPAGFALDPIPMRRGLLVASLDERGVVKVRAVDA